MIFQICRWHDHIIIDNGNMHWMMQKVGVFIDLIFFKKYKEMGALLLMTRQDGSESLSPHL